MEEKRAPGKGYLKDPSSEERWERGWAVLKVMTKDSSWAWGMVVQSANQRELLKDALSEPRSAGREWRWERPLAAGSERKKSSAERSSSPGKTDLKSVSKASIVIGR